ncbi:phosphoglycerate kinase [Nematocida sp. AWRm77]|nr:phosphoglycerate kinase [Nematocida sp. AWRm77]
MKQWTHEVYAGKKSLGDVDVLGKRVFLRVDYNVPISGGQITDDTKISRSLATIRFLVKRGASKIVIGTHLGRPETVDDPEQSPEEGGVRPLLECLNRHLQGLEDACVQFEFSFMARKSVAKRWIMVQNLRTLDVEKTGREGCSKALFDTFIAENCDLMVSDGFGVLHRNDYSVVGLCIDKVSGLLVDSEMQGLSLLLGGSRPSEEKSPARVPESKEVGKFIERAQTFSSFSVHSEKPIDLLIVGGCKLEDKLSLVKNLLRVGSNVFLGGLLGASFCIKPYTQDVLEIVEQSMQTGASILLPKDYITDSLKAVSAEELSSCKSPLERVKDIGPETEELLKKAVSKCTRLFWNGTLGQAEVGEFAHGTVGVLNALRERKQALLGGTETESMLCAGGGDTAGYIYSHGYADAFDFVFTGGGATLEALEGKVLPGVTALMNSH